MTGLEPKRKMGNGRRVGSLAVRVQVAGGAALLAWSSSLNPGAARADPLANLGGESLDLSADRLEIDVHAGTAVFTGHVSLVKGALKVECPRIDLKYDEAPRVTWAKGSGGVTAEIRGVHAEAPEVELDLARHILDLHGGVRLTRGLGWLNADKATIEIDSAKVTLREVKGSIPVVLPRP